MSGTARTITVRYTLNPPAQGDGLSTEKTLKVDVNANAEKDGAGYYTVLKEAIEEAREQLGDDLTKWRDAVGKAELSKETKKTLKYDAEEDEEDEEEQ